MGVLNKEPVLLRMCETTFHRVLDMAFGEDQSRVRKEYAPEKHCGIRHIALNFVK